MVPSFLSLSPLAHQKNPSVDEPRVRNPPCSDFLSTIVLIFSLEQVIFNETDEMGDTHSFHPSHGEMHTLIYTHTHTHGKQGKDANEIGRASCRERV